jgi:hypothetical protein
MKLFRRRTDEPPPTAPLTYDHLLGQMRGHADHEVMGWGFTPERRLADTRYHTALAEERALQLRALAELEQAEHELELERRRRAVELGGVPRRAPMGGGHPTRNPDQNAVSAPLPAAPTPGTSPIPDSERSDDELMVLLRAIRDRADPDHPPGVLPPQALVREELKIGFKRLRRLRDRLTAEEDELRSRRGA